MPVIYNALNTHIVEGSWFGSSPPAFRTIYLQCNYFHQAAEQFVPNRLDSDRKEQPQGWLAAAPSLLVTMETAQPMLPGCWSAQKDAQLFSATSALSNLDFPPVPPQGF